MTNSNEENLALQNSELGHKTAYDQQYNPDRLFAVPRRNKRIEIGIDPNSLPFVGLDCWNHYETSWLNPKGKPIVATAQIYYDCSSPFIIESKSLKLYLNSFNQSTFSSIREVEDIIIKDLENKLKSPVKVIIKTLTDNSTQPLMQNFMGTCLDDLDIECKHYTISPELLHTNDCYVEETLYSNLLKSNCLVTNQPDWGSVQIIYKGNHIIHQDLLRYLVSYRNHNEFHEQCIERIFADIMRHCKPKELTIHGRYTRRGGLDINPVRSTQPQSFRDIDLRLIRQ